MDLPGDMPVTLVIKAPNQRMADQTVDCMLGWTIKKLKQHLETVYPSKPKHNEQRLIYSGRLLQDHLTLKEILRQFDDAEFSSKHTVHLVCSTVNDSPTSSSSSSTSTQNGYGSNPTTTLSPTGQTNTMGNNSHTSSQNDGLRYRGQNLPASTTATSLPGAASSSYYSPAAGTGGENPLPGYASYPYTPEQYAWMVQQQQLYSQYMMQYMQYYQNVYYPGQPFNPQMPMSPFLQQPDAGAGLPQQAQPQQAAQGPAAAAANNGGAAGPARQNVRMNAQGGMEEDDEDDGEPRDWLHHTYFLMRFLTFMGILFFYSNLTRFLIVFAGSFTVYLLQRFRKYMQRAQREQEQQQQRQQQQQQQQQENQAAPQEQNEQQQQDSESRNRPGENNTEVNGEREGDSQAGQPQIQQPQEPDTSRLGRAFIFLCNTIQVFFTSLLPAPPELLEGN